MINCWKMEINGSTGMVAFIYVTDSDNDKKLEKEQSSPMKRTI